VLKNTKRKRIKNENFTSAKAVQFYSPHLPVRISFTLFKINTVPFENAMENEKRKIKNCPEC